MKPNLQRKSIDGDTQDLPEIAKAIDAITKSFEDFKEANEKELEEIKKSGSADVVTKEHVEKLNGEVDKKYTALEALLIKEQEERKGLESRINNRGLNGSSDDEKKQLANLQSFNMTLKMHQKDSFGGGFADIENYNHYTGAYKKYMRHGDKMSAFLTAEEAKAITVGSDPAGGFFVTSEVSNEVEKFVHESSAIRSLARVDSIATDAKEGKYRLGKPNVVWVGEQGTRAETTTPTWAKWRLPVFEAYAWPEISLQSLEDAGVDVERELAEEIAEEFMRDEETKFHTGTGVGQPRGFLTYSAGTPANTDLPSYTVIRQTNSGAAGAFAASDPGDIFHTIIGQTKADFLANANWLMNRVTLATTRKLKDGDGTYLWEKSFQARQPFQLLGYGVQMDENMPAIAANSLSIAFADMRRAYRILDRLGISTLIDPYTSTTGMVKYKTRRRVGGGVVNFEAIQLIKFAA